MATELQFAAGKFLEMVALQTQDQLYSVCFPPLGDGEIYIDHANVAADPVELASLDSRIRLRVPIDLFVVLRAALMGAPNGVPPGANTRFDRVVLVLEISIFNTSLNIEAVDVELGDWSAFSDAADTAKNAVTDAARSSVDLGPVLTTLGQPIPQRTSVDFADGVIAFRFDPVGPAATHLTSGQEWGLFLDGSAVERLTLSRIPAADQLSYGFQAHWSPKGAVPHVDVQGKAEKRIVVTVDVDLRLGFDYSLAPGSDHIFRTFVHWSAHADGGPLMPAAAETAVERETRARLSATVANSGGTPIGGDSAVVDTVLEPFAIGHNGLQYRSVVATPAGMTIGGTVRLANPSTMTVNASVSPFGAPRRLVICSVSAKTGSGEPSKKISIGQTSSSAEIWLDEYGKLCRYEILEPNETLEKYFWGEDPWSIKVNVPSLIANLIDHPVQVIVRTARGVRLVDLGIPPKAEVDDTGQVTNARTDYIPNCNYLHDFEEHGINWGDFQDYDPLLDPDRWSGALTGSGIDVQMVTLSGLEPGELAEFRSRDNLITVTVGNDGTVRIPVTRRLADRAPARLELVSQIKIVGRFKVESAVFVPIANFGAGLSNRLELASPETAVLHRQFDRRTETHQFGTLGAAMAFRSADATSDGQRGAPEVGSVSVFPATPIDAHNAEDAEDGRYRLLSEFGLSLRAARTVTSIPGFEQLPVAVVTFFDNLHAVIDFGASGQPRVAGRIRGPIAQLQTAGNWAIGERGGRVAVHRILRSEHPRQEETNIET